jgi:hypothetical protein
MWPPSWATAARAAAVESDRSSGLSLNTLSTRSWSLVRKVLGRIAAIGVGTYGFITSSSRQRELDKLTVNGIVSDENRVRASELRSQMKSAKTVGFVSLGVGIATAGAAVGLYLYSGSQPSGRKAKIGLAPNAVFLTASF